MVSLTKFFPLVYSCLFASKCDSWGMKTGPHLFPRKFQSENLIASSTLALIIAISPNPALAAESSVFSRDYVDPLHPLCERHIRVYVGGKQFKYKGTDVNAPSSEQRGCSEAEIQQFGLQNVAFQGTIVDERVQVADRGLVGTWEPAVGTASGSLGGDDQDGIRWNDGNKWTAIPKPEKSLGKKIGELVIGAYVGASTLAGVKGAYDGWQRKQQE